jgi:uncharacterized lipoprotein YmbA
MRRFEFGYRLLVDRLFVNSRSNAILLPGTSNQSTSNRKAMRSCVHKQMRWSVPLLLTATLIAGCPSFSPQPDRSRFFALTANAEADSAADSSGLEQLSLGVGPVRIPGYLDREELVTRVAENRFDVAQNDRWIEPLEENLSRVLAQNLYTLLRSERIVRYPWPNSRRITHQVEIEILRFEPTAAREAQLSARWVIVDTATKQPLANKTSFLKRPIRQESKEAAVDAMSETLSDLSREIADTVRTIIKQR